MSLNLAAAMRAAFHETIYVTVERGGEPFLRIDVYEGEPAHYAFQDAIAWSDDGEWDPPGGWRPFRILLTTGAAVDVRE